MISKMGEVMSLTIIMYHYVREIKGSQFPKIKGLEFEGFKRQLDYLEKHYNLIKPPKTSPKSPYPAPTSPYLPPDLSEKSHIPPTPAPRGRRQVWRNKRKKQEKKRRRRGVVVVVALQLM